jgi:cytochrome c556
MNRRPRANQSNSKALALFAVAALFLIGAATTFEAHLGAKGVVKQRLMAMKSMFEDMKALAAMVRGMAPYDPAKTSSIAAALRDHARKIPEQFPKGSIHGPSEALPDIWKHWRTFKSHADEMANAADELTRTVGDGQDAMQAQSFKIGGACQTCHKSFRAKKKYGLQAANDERRLSWVLAASCFSYRRHV